MWNCWKLSANAYFGIVRSPVAGCTQRLRSLRRRRPSQVKSGRSELPTRSVAPVYAHRTAKSLNVVCRRSDVHTPCHGCQPNKQTSGKQQKINPLMGGVYIEVPWRRIRRSSSPLKKKDDHSKIKQFTASNDNDSQRIYS